MDAERTEATARAIRDSLSSPNVADSNFEPANVVDVIAGLASATRQVAQSITPNVAGCQGASGGHVESLTEAVLDASHSLKAIAEALSDVAAAIREAREE